MSTPTATAFIGKQCSPYGFQFAADTYALAKGVGSALARAGGDTWFFITADYEFGASLQANTEEFVKTAGGKVLGSAHAPLGTADFSSYLLQAKASGAKVIGLANAGTDLQNCIKQGELHQAGRRVRHHQGRPALRHPAYDHQRCRFTRRGGLQRPCADQFVLLEPDPGNARLDAALHCENERTAERIQRRLLRRRDALAEGGQGNRDTGCRRGRGKDAGNATGRFLQ